MTTPRTGAREMREITALLARWRDGDAEAAERLFALVYRDLRRRARRQLERAAGATLDTTGLVHEAFLRLARAASAGFADRGHFFAVASLAMRQVLVDEARSRLADKRGGGRATLAWDSRGGPVDLSAHAAQLVALDDALARLRRVDERAARIVEMHFFAGLSFDEVAELLALSTRTVGREWRKARAFLYAALGGPMPA